MTHNAFGRQCMAKSGRCIPDAIARNLFMIPIIPNALNTWKISRVVGRNNTYITAPIRTIRIPQISCIFFRVVCIFSIIVSVCFFISGACYKIAVSAKLQIIFNKQILFLTFHES